MEVGDSAGLEAAWPLAAGSAQALRPDRGAVARGPSRATGLLEEPRAFGATVGLQAHGPVQRSRSRRQGGGRWRV